jgi:hypothetical protein
LIVPFSTSTWPVGRSVSRATSTADSTSSVVAKPISTINSPISLPGRVRCAGVPVTERVVLVVMWGAMGIRVKEGEN